MNTLLFKYAVEVDKMRSISQAAENLYMAQPNLSKAIRELEELLNITIFSRTNKGVIPTKKGIEFLAYAKNVLGEIEKMESLGVCEGINNQEFRISIPRGSYISNAIIDFVKAFNPDFPIEISIKETNSLEIINDLVSDVSQIGIIRYKTSDESFFLKYLDEKKIAYDLIWEFDYLVLLSRYHPLAYQANIVFDDLNQFVEIAHADMEIPFLHHAGMAHPENTENGLRRVYVYERYTQFELLSQMKNTYMLVSPIPEELLDRYQLIQRKCKKAGYRMKDLLVYRADFQVSEVYKEFIGKLYQSKNDVAYRRYN